MKLKRVFAGFLILVMCLSCVNLQTVETQASTGTYWIKVNKQANVATVYQKKNGDWVAIKAMLTSCGGKNTTSGTFNTKAKYRWHTLMGPSYGQYCTRIVGGILFHSVWYYTNGNKKSQAVKEFNKLGSTASHGCVRLSTEDAKWIYDHCSVGTKVTIYSSSNPGPLGKPAAYKMPSSAGKTNWDPTDVSSNNPYYQALPILSQKVTNVQYGDSAYSTAKKLVKATQKNGKKIKSLTVTVKKYNSSKKKYVSASYSNKSEGKYQIKYKLVSSKGVSITKTFNFTVQDTKSPTVKVSKTSATLNVNDKNAVQWLSSAKMANGTDRKSSAKVYVKAPGAGSYTSYSYNNAKNYVFNKEGKYSVYYVVTNKNKTSASTKSSVITVTVKAKNTSTEESTTTEQPGSSEEPSTSENSSSETESSEVSSVQ
jgi:hypothetical protein